MRLKAVLQGFALQNRFAGQPFFVNCTPFLGVERSAFGKTRARPANSMAFDRNQIGFCQINYPASFSCGEAGLAGFAGLLTAKGRRR
jgi:hypothetical protein